VPSTWRRSRGPIRPTVAPVSGATVAAMDEHPLTGGRITAGVVRVGETVRRPVGPNSDFVRALFAHLEEAGFDAAPRYLGQDERGREIFSFQPGDVPDELNATITDETLASAARLIRRFHDATVGTEIARGGEVVCHHDLSPCNFVFRDALPVGIIDFDAAAPGERLLDLGYALLLWLNLGTDGPPPAEQASRIRLFCDAYGVEVSEVVLNAVVRAVDSNIEKLRAARRLADVEWWQAQLDWLSEHGSELTSALRV
jgi:Ser/Thr protein kinase RdoA (MazF antagonist)